MTVTVIHKPDDMKMSSLYEAVAQNVCVHASRFDRTGFCISPVSFLTTIRAKSEKGHCVELKISLHDDELNDLLTMLMQAQAAIAQSKAGGLQTSPIDPADFAPDAAPDAAPEGQP